MGGGRGNERDCSRIKLPVKGGINVSLKGYDRHNQPTHHFDANESWIRGGQGRKNIRWGGETPTKKGRSLSGLRIQENGSAQTSVGSTVSFLNTFAPVQRNAPWKLSYLSLAYWSDKRKIGFNLMQSLGILSQRMGWPGVQLDVCLA